MSIRFHTCSDTKFNFQTLVQRRVSETVDRRLRGLVDMRVGSLVSEASNGILRGLGDHGRKLSLTFSSTRGNSGG
jgi:hypothetical protein